MYSARVDYQIRVEYSDTPPPSRRVWTKNGIISIIFNRYCPVGRGVGDLLKINSLLKKPLKYSKYS